MDSSEGRGQLSVSVVSKEERSEILYLRNSRLIPGGNNRERERRRGRFFPEEGDPQ